MLNWATKSTKFNTRFSTLTKVIFIFCMIVGLSVVILGWSKFFEKSDKEKRRDMIDEVYKERGLEAPFWD